MTNTSAIQAIKARINIVDVVRRFVALKQMGNRWSGLCPFHQEKTPSFSVNAEEGFFYCFGCQAKGDIFDFYCQINGINFREALEQLAAEAGISLENVQANPQQQQEQSQRRTVLRMYEHALRHYVKNLQSSAGAACRDYLAKRRINQEMITQFNLGWSLPQWRDLANSLQHAGFSQQLGATAGLYGKNAKGDVYDRFRERLIFPIHNLSGQCIAFGGRLIAPPEQGKETAKYINSTDTPLYKKGEQLYGLYQARASITKSRTGILTEGYMDVLSLHQHGYTQACGVLGTALTPEQVRRLAGFCSRLELVFDGDTAGQKAALKACGMVLALGIACQVIILPQGEDIDDVLQKQGATAFEQLRKQAPDGLGFCARALAQLAPKEALDWVHNFINSVQQAELKSGYITRLTTDLGLDERELRQALPATPRTHSKVGTAPQKLPTRAGGGIQERQAQAIMNFIVRFPQHTPQLQAAGVGLVLHSPWAQQLLKKIAATAPDYNPSVIVTQLTEAEKSFWAQCRIIAPPPLENAAQELEDICTRIQHLHKEQEARACRIALAQDKGDFDRDLLQAADDLAPGRNHG